VRTDCRGKIVGRAYALPTTNNQQPTTKQMTKEMKRKLIISKLQKNKNKPNYIYKLEQQKKVK